MEAPFNQFPGKSRRSTETVEYAADTPEQVLADSIHTVPLNLAEVNYHRQVEFAGKHKLSGERTCLDIARGTVAVIIEPCLPHCHDRRMFRQPGDGEHIVGTRLLGFVGMYANSGMHESLVFQRKFNRFPRCGQVASGIDHRSHTGLAGTGDDRVAISIEIPEIKIAADPIAAAKLLLACNLVATGGEAKRMIKQGGATIDGQKLTDPNAQITPRDGMIVRVGKRKFAKLTVNQP